MKFLKKTYFGKLSPANQSCGVTIMHIKIEDFIKKINMKLK